jgi:ketosteroid isomerase-like protein
MSEESVEIVRRAHVAFQDGWSRGNPAAAFDAGLVAPEFEWLVPAETPGLRRSYRGREEWAEFLETWTGDFEWALELERLIDAGDGRVVVLSLQRATGKASGVPVELRMGGIWTVKGGQVIRAENFLEPADALRAAGLSDSARSSALDE